MIIVEGKFDRGRGWGGIDDISVIEGDENGCKCDFLCEINEKLSDWVEVIEEGERIVYEDGEYEFDEVRIVIDEVVGLGEGVNKRIKEGLF